MILKTAFILLLGTATSAWATTILVFDPAPVAVSVGDTFALNVDLLDIDGLSPASPVAGFSFDVVFPTFLQVVSAPVEEGFFLATGCCFFPGTIDNVNGVISGISDVSIFGAETGFDTLVQIEFTAIATGTGQIAFQNPGLTDPDANSISIDAANPADVVSSPVVSSPTPEPAAWSMAGLGIAIAIARNRRRFT